MCLVKYSWNIQDSLKKAKMTILGEVATIAVDIGTVAEVFSQIVELKKSRDRLQILN